MLRSFVFLFSLIILLAAACCSAADDIPYLELDTVIVSGMRPLTGADAVSHQSTSVFYSAVNIQDVQGKITSVAEAISSVSGIQVRQGGGIGSYSAAYLRGAAPEQILVFIDGVPVNTAAGGGVDLSTISLADIETIEIYRGATPFEFSNSAIGGVINLRTHDAHRRDHSRLSLVSGSFGTRRLSGLWQSGGVVDMLISLDRLNSENNFDYRADNSTQYNPDDDYDTHRNNNELKQSNALLKIGGSLAGDRHLAFIGQWLQKDQGIPNWNNSSDGNISFNTERANLQLKLLQGTNIDKQTNNQAIRLHYKAEQEIFDDRRSQIGLGRQWNSYLTRGYGADLISKHRLGSHALTLQGNAAQEKFTDTNLLDKTQAVSSHRRTLSLGAQDNITFNDNYQISAATRWHQSTDHGSLANGVQRENQRFYMTGQAGAKISVTGNWLLKTNIGRYTREPSFAELYSDRGLFTGNYELIPENSVNMDFGWRFHSPGIGASWEFSAYHNRIKDAIVRIYDSRGIGHSENVAAAQITGIENTLQHSIKSDLMLSVSLTWQRPENRSANTANRTRQLPGRYTRAAQVNIDYGASPANLFFRYHYEAGAFYDTQNLLPVKARSIMDTGVRWSTSRALQLSLTVNNLTDEHYQQFNGFPSPGRLFLLSLDYTM